MANPCLNCHSTPNPESIPDLKRSQLCPAEDRWPDALTQDLPIHQEVNSWVRKNYVDTLVSDDPEAVPWEFQVGLAQLEFSLTPNNFAWKFNPKAPRLISRGNGEAEISGDLQIQDNQWPLTMETLVNFKGLAWMLESLGPYSGLWESDSPWFYNIPNRVSVGDYGALHFITKVSNDQYDDWTDTWPGRASLLKHFVPKIKYYFPNRGGHRMCAPIGREDPPAIPMCWADEPPKHHDLTQCCEAIGKQMSHGALASCLAETHPLPFCAPMEYLDPKNPRLDFGLTRFIPAAFRNSAGRLPENFELNDLLQRILATPKKKQDSTFSLRDLELLQAGRSPEHLLELLKSADIQLDIQDLTDLFLPGILDLAPSYGKITASWSEERGTVILEAHDFFLQADPMEYPHSTASTPAPFHLHAAQLTPELSPIDGAASDHVAGIRVEWDPRTGETSLRANLHLNLDITLPLLGRIQWSSPIYFNTQLNSGGRPIPGKTTLNLPDLNLRRHHSKVPLDTHLHFVISDDPLLNGTHYLETSSNQPHFNVWLAGDLGNGKGTAMELDGFIPVGTLPGFGYQWESLRHDLEFLGSFKLKGPKDTHSTSYFSVNTFKPMPMNSRQSDQDFGIRMNLDVLDGERNAEEEIFHEELAIKTGEPDRAWLVDGGRIQFTRVKLWEPGFENMLQVHAKALRLGPIELQDPELKLRLSQILLEKSQTQFSIPIFRFKANGQKGAEGLIQGPIQIELTPCKDSARNPKDLCSPKESRLSEVVPGEMNVLWNQAERQLTFENLNLTLEAQGIQLPKLLQDQQNLRRREVYRSGQKLKVAADGLGLDGRVTGHFDFNFADWSGKGDLRILGDRNGDVYLLDPSGDRIKPPLLSRTHWRFSRFNKFLFDKGFALGRYRLSTRANTNALRKFGYSINYETDVVMGHRDVMFKPGGIDEANFAYYRKLLAEILRRGGLDLLQAGEEP